MILHTNLKQIISTYLLEGSPHGVVVNMLDCNVVIRTFKLKTCYYIHIQNNTLGKSLNLNCTSLPVVCETCDVSSIKEENLNYTPESALLSSPITIPVGKGINQ